MRAWILGLIAATALSGTAMAQGAKPAIVYDLGGKFDKSFNEGVYNGAEQFKKETGIELPRVRDQERRRSASRRCAASPATATRPIVAVGFSQAAALEKVAKEFPKTKFAIIDMVVDAAERAVDRLQGAGGLVPRRPAGREGLEDRQGRLRRRHGHPADPQVRLRLRAGREVRQRRTPRCSRT